MAFSWTIQGLLIALFLSVPLVNPQILKPEQSYRSVIQLVPTPVPVNHDPQPVPRFVKPVEVAKIEPPVDALRLPAATPKPKVKMEDAPAPEVSIAPKKLDVIPSAKPIIPKEPVRTNVFSTGSSATPTIARAPQQVQTGGFGDPNGVPARANENRQINIAQAGNFDLPSGPGYGNGTGGSRGARGVVASAGFGNGVAIGGSGSSSNGAVREGGFGDATAVPVATRSRQIESAAKISPAEIISKPTPVYTDEGRKLHIEGEVLLEVVLQASGQVHVLRVVHGLGHGLDDAAVRAAEQIRFKPAMRDGQPTDFTAVLHIIFQLA